MYQIIYRVNANDEITFVDSNWSEFAERNGMLLPLPVAVIGTKLWKHISDMTTRHFYQTFLERVRKSKKTIVLPFRCDSPSKYRKMELQIVHLPENELEFRSILLHEKDREPAESPLAKLSRELQVISMCVWCKRVKTSDWCEPEDALRELNLFEDANLPLITHMSCPACESQSLKIVDEE